MFYINSLLCPKVLENLVFALNPKGAKYFESGESSGPQAGGSDLKPSAGNRSKVMGEPLSRPTLPDFLSEL